MNKQTIALIGVAITLAGGLGAALVNCFNAQQSMLNAMNTAFIEQSKQHSKDLSDIHDEYNAKIIDLIIKGN